MDTERVLVLSAEESTWPVDRPILFLGEWCVRYDRREALKNIDWKIAAPLILTPEQRREILNALAATFRTVLSELTETLNKLHDVRYDIRYWEILLGHWLKRYIEVIYNRYWTLTRAFENYRIIGATRIKGDAHAFTPNDSLAFILDCNNQLWNHALASNLLSFLDFQRRGDTEVIISGPYSNQAKTLLANQVRKSIKRIVWRLPNAIFTRMLKNTDAVILNSYLSRSQEMLLHLRLMQAPARLASHANFEVFPLNHALREQLSPNSTEHSGFELALRKLIPEYFPAIYLEGYAPLRQRAALQPWPHKPKFIYTANNFDTDELFKIWTAEKVAIGVPYFVGQHGNNYGTLYGYENMPEVNTADRFFTWGWRHTDKDVPAFLFQRAKSSKSRQPRGEELLLVQYPPPYRLGPEDCWYDFRRFQEQQIEFASALPKAILEKLTIRLHMDSVRSETFDEVLWRDFKKDIRIQYNNSPMQRQLKETRLVMFSYDSTGLLENLNNDIPTMCFWRNEFDHLNDSARSYYALLKQVGIFHSGPAEAAEAVKLAWPNIKMWWSSPELQNARKTFCEEYARNVKNPLSFLATSLCREAKIISTLQVGIK